MAQDERPSLLILRSHIGYPSPDHTDDFEAHGLAFDADDVRRTKEVMGIPDEPFWAPDDVVDAYRANVAATGAEVHGEWEKRLAGWQGDRAASGRVLGRHRPPGLGGRPPKLRAGRERRHPAGHGEGADGLS